MAKRRAKSTAVQSNLSRLMGERRVRIIDVSRATGISRNMLSKLYYDRARRVDLGDIAKLCDYFECSVSDLFEMH
jgi:putative transcriptional regulator